MSQNGTTNAASNASVRRDRFASGAAVRLELSDGDWVLVRAELTYGQQRRLAMAGVSGVPPALTEQTGEGRLSVDWAVFQIERLVTWVLDWSFRDGDGDRVTVSREAIEALHPDAATEIDAALTAHIEAQDAKKSRPGPDGDTWAERTRSDLIVCKAFGWSWEELMATPARVVWTAMELLHEAQADAAPPGQEWRED